MPAKARSIAKSVGGLIVYFMRISRKKRPQKSLIPRYNKNQWIKSEEVRVLDAENQNLGVMKTKDAIALAAEKEMDLVEINPKAVPPVAKIIDFGSFKYQKEKEARKQKARTHVSEMKGIRLSMRISDHDMDVRSKQSTKFLDRGDKVKIEIILRGRERAKANIAYDVINKFVKLIEETYQLRYEQPATRQGAKVTAIVAKK